MALIGSGAGNGVCPGAGARQTGIGLGAGIVIVAGRAVGFAGIGTSSRTCLASSRIVALILRIAEKYLAANAIRANVVHALVVTPASASKLVEAIAGTTIAIVEIAVVANFTKVDHAIATYRTYIRVGHRIANLGARAIRVLIACTYIACGIAILRDAVSIRRTTAAQRNGNARHEFDYERVGRPRIDDRPITQVYRRAKITGKHDIVSVVYGRSLGDIAGCTSERLAPDVYAIRIEFGHECIDRPCTRKRPAAHIDGTRELPANDHVVRAIGRRGNKDLTTRVAKRSAPHVVATRVEFGDKAIIPAANGENAATKIDGRRNESSNDDIAHTVGRYAAGHFVARRAEAFAPDVIATCIELGLIDVVAACTGERGASETHRALKKAGEDNVTRAIHRHRVCILHA